MTAIVHLIGFPGAGKYTIARELARLAALDDRRIVVLDNHHTANVIFAVLDVDGITPLPRTVWDRVDEVREALYQSIEELSPADWSFVFTNVLTDKEPKDQQIVDRLVRLAATRGSHYVPVVVTCAVDELVQRVDSPDRRARLKWVDPEAIRALATEGHLLRVDEHAPLQLDVTSLAPDAAARRILDHLATVEGGG